MIEILGLFSGWPPAGIGVVRRARRTDAGVDRGGDRKEATAEPGPFKKVDVLGDRNQNRQMSGIDV